MMMMTQQRVNWEHLYANGWVWNNNRMLDVKSAANSITTGRLLSSCRCGSHCGRSSIGRRRWEREKTQCQAANFHISYSQMTTMYTRH
jgi:hypothetical protein